MEASPPARCYDAASTPTVAHTWQHTPAVTTVNQDGVTYVVAWAKIQNRACLGASTHWGALQMAIDRAVENLGRQPAVGLQLPAPKPVPRGNCERVCGIIMYRTGNVTANGKRTGT